MTFPSDLPEWLMLTWSEFGGGMLALAGFAIVFVSMQRAERR